MHLNKIYTWLRHPGESLSQRVVHAGFWVFALRIVDRLFGLARTIVLARLLAPTDFGLFGIALLGMSALETFSQTGFNAALIQKKEDTKPYLDTVWTVQAIRGILLALILFAIAPYVAAFFEAPAAKPILQVIALSVLLQGFTNIGVIYFQKELEFHKQFAYVFSGTLINVGVAISAAFLLRSVWALVFGLLAGNLVRMVVSYFVHPYRPRPRLEGQKIKELFTFGKWVLMSTILHFLLTQGDDAFVGKILGTTALGLYQVAYRISNLAATEISAVIQQVTLPAYSKLQDRAVQLQEAYIQVQKVLAYISAPITGGIVVLAPDFVRLFLGEQWLSMVPALQVLAIWGFIRSINGNVGPLVMSVGKPKLATWLSVGRLVLVAILIYPLTMRWSILGTGAAICVPGILLAPVYQYIALRIIRCSSWRLVKQIVLPMFATAVMAATVEVFRYLVLNQVGFFAFLLLIAVGMISYLLMTQVIDRVCGYGIMPLIRIYIKRVWGAG